MPIIKSSSDPYTSCHILGTKAHRLKQYDQASNTVSCCTAQDIGVTALAKTQDNNTPINNLYDFLVTKTNASNDSKCDFSKFISSTTGETNFKQNYRDLYENTEVQEKLYNILYTGDSTHNASQLVPTLTDKTVTCPTDYVPYLVEVFLPNFETFEYAYFCSKDKNTIVSNLNNLKIPGTNNRVHYNLSVFENNDGSKCNTNTCNTKVNSFLGQATHPEYVDQHEPNSLSLWVIIVFTILGLIILALFFALIWFVQKKNESKRFSRR